jgi:hypothetical protein
MMKKIIFLTLALFIAFPLVFADPGSPQNATAQGGNISIIDVNLSSGATNIWQGFYGTVTGGIFLEDAAGSHFYDWNVVNVIGTILATRELIADWSTINCSNQTEIYEEEERLGITNETSIGINDTYHNTTHPSFIVANREMVGCRSTLTNNQTDIQSVFWNVILNANSTATVYTAVLDNDRLGFNGTISDFQLLVPVNTSTGQATYKIYVELT